MPKRPRSAPTYLVFNARFGAWDLRFRYIDSIGRKHDPRERSPYPQDLVRSKQWAPWRRQEIIREIEAEILRVERESAPPLTVGQVLDAYAADCRERGTRWADEEPRANVIRATLGADVPAAELTIGRVAAWRSALREARKLSGRSCNAYTAILMAAMNLAVERGHLAENPMRNLRRLPEPKRQPPALDERQVGAILWACRVWERWERRPREDGRRQYLPIATRVLIGYWTGSRPEAIDALRWRDLDLQRGLLVIPSTKNHPNVPCPLVPQLVDHLRARRAALAPAGGELVLAAPRTGTRAVNWRPPWRRVLRIANRRLEPHERIPEATALHVLRHSRITHLLLAGTSPQVVAQITGTSIVMIARRYAHVLVRGLEAEVARSREHPSIQAIEGYASGRNFRPDTPHPVRQEQDTPRRKSLRRKESS